MGENLINEHGIFTSNEVLNQTAEEMYAEYLKNKNNPPKIEPTETELLQKQLLETQNLVLELQYKLTNKDLEIK
ncbi:hypothetical protein [Clostridium sp. ZBS17]|uniref:hypothetical protein n=1 Tax=Clostridium sp. ZBS17 TaxID=2949968 RepID=UPI0020796A4B|nr:hypothetical protein [Clostridium sp. ZBS17]